MQSTRQQILEYMQRHGRATVKELGALLGLTSTGIRQHLTVLERDGLVDAREERGRVGRPTLVYSLTEQADALFPKRYDDLAGVILEEIREVDGNERLHQLLSRVAHRLAEPYEDRVAGLDLPERVKETTNIMEEQGCLVEWVEEGGEYVIVIERVKLIRPALALVYMKLFRPARRPKPDVTLMILPEPCSIMWGMTAREQ
jgi:predicted ArsR family transcriptional regulator